jgi:hypothetical protein
MCAATVNELRRRRLGWFRGVDVGHVGHRGHAHSLRHGRHRLGHDGRIMAAISGEVRCDVAFVVSAGLRLAEARDEGVDVPEARSGSSRIVRRARRLARTRAGTAGSPDATWVGSTATPTVLLDRDVGRQSAAHERRVQGPLGEPADVAGVVAPCRDDRLDVMVRIEPEREIGGSRGRGSRRTEWSRRARMTPPDGRQYLGARSASEVLLLPPTEEDIA